MRRLEADQINARIASAAEGKYGGEEKRQAWRELAEERLLERREIQRRMKEAEEQKPGCLLALVGYRRRIDELEEDLTTVNDFLRALSEAVYKSEVSERQARGFWAEAREEDLRELLTQAGLPVREEHHLQMIDFGRLQYEDRRVRIWNFPENDWAFIDGRYVKVSQSLFIKLVATLNLNVEEEIQISCQREEKAATITDHFLAQFHYKKGWFIGWPDERYGDYSVGVPCPLTKEEILEKLEKYRRSQNTP